MIVIVLVMIKICLLFSIIEQLALEAARGAAVYLLVGLPSAKGGGGNHFHIPAAVLVRRKPIDGCWVGPMPLWMYGEEADLYPCHYQKLNTNIPAIQPLTLSLYRLHYPDSSDNDGTVLKK